MRRLTFLLAAFLLGVLSGCARCSVSRSSLSAVTAEYFRVVDLTTCRHVVTTFAGSTYGSHVVAPARVDSSAVDPFTCATRAGR